MSDMTGGGLPDFQTLYQQLLQQYPRSKGKGASPQADLKAAVAWKKMIDGELGFDPTTYESPMKKQYSPKSSAVKVQYGNDPFVSGVLGDIESGAQTSSSAAATLIDPATGEVKPEFANQGITTAQATTAIEAAKAFEKEKAQNTVDQLDYEARQNSDPTYGRTPGSTGGKHILPEGDLNGTEKPDFTYSQGVADLLKGLSTQGDVSLPMLAPKFGHPTQQVGEIATKTNPYGGMQVDTSIHQPNEYVPSPQESLMGSGPAPGQALAANVGRTMTPITSPATGSFAARPQGNIFQRLSQGLQHRTPIIGPSAQERAVSGVSAMQDFANKYAQPVRSQANNAAVQKLLQIMALQG